MGEKPATEYFIGNKKFPDLRITATIEKTSAGKITLDILDGETAENRELLKMLHEAILRSSRKRDRKWTSEVPQHGPFVGSFDTVDKSLCSLRNRGINVEETFVDD